MTDLEITTIEKTPEEAKENFDNLNEAWKNNPFTRFEGKHVEVSYDAATTNSKIAHSLGWVPNDILVTKLTAGTVTINWANIDSTYIDITVSAACTVRMMVGSYLEALK
jgi:hypothetical protein